MILKLRNSMKRVTRGFRKNDSGATAVEFAFVGGPFLFLLMATFETGLNFLTEYSIQSATTTASRMIRTGQVQNGGVSAADFKTELCSHVPKYLDCASKVIVNVETRSDFAATTTRTTAGDGNGGIDPNLQNGPAFQPGNPGDVVIVETFYEWELFTPFITKLLSVHGSSPPPHWLANHGDNKRLISGVAVFMNEPFNPVGGGN